MNIKGVISKKKIQAVPFWLFIGLILFALGNPIKNYFFVPFFFFLLCGTTKNSFENMSKRENLYIRMVLYTGDITRRAWIWRKYKRLWGLSLLSLIITLGFYSLYPDRRLALYPYLMIYSLGLPLLQASVTVPLECMGQEIIQKLVFFMQSIFWLTFLSLFETGWPLFHTCIGDILQGDRVFFRGFSFVFSLGIFFLLVLINYTSLKISLKMELKREF